MLTPLVSDALLARLRETFPDDVVGLSRLSHEAIRERIGEQRVVKVLQAWHNEQTQDYFTLATSAGQPGTLLNGPVAGGG